MRKIYHIPINDAMPSISFIFRNQGIPEYQTSDERTSKMAEEAIHLYQKLAAPAGVLMEISRNDVQYVFNGEGRNENDSPIKPIYKNSDHLALFAVTIGEKVCKEIVQLFANHDYAIGSMLDSTASEGTEIAAQAMENIYHQYLANTNRFNSQDGVLRFSPGYCGWHISAQKKLFEVLHPDEIGIRLNDSFLMQPLKSISGIIVSGKREIFDFEDTFSFCRDCATHTCRDRMKAILEP